MPLNFGNATGFNVLGFFENISLPSWKKESDNEKKMRNKSTFYNGGVFCQNVVVMLYDVVK